MHTFNIKYINWSGKFNNNKIIKNYEVLFPHSLGLFYTAITQFLGFKNYGDEYKVMGLAPYGEPKYLKQLEDILVISDDGFFTLNKKYFNSANFEIYKKEDLVKNNKFYKFYGYDMPKHRAIDIDDINDWKIAEALYLNK